jgi:hypothetical protein
MRIKSSLPTCCSYSEPDKSYLPLPSYLFKIHFGGVHKIENIDCQLRHILPPARNNSASTERILMKDDIWDFSENLSRKFKFNLNLTIMTGKLHEDIFTLMRVSLLKWEMFQIGNVYGIKTNFMSLTFFQKSCPLWNNVQNCGGCRQAMKYCSCALHAG